MNQAKYNEFTEFDLTEAETLSGQTLTTLQLQVLHNLRTTSARKKLALKFNPHDIALYQQQEAEITSEINLITYIIECHEIAMQITYTQNQEDQDYNPDSELPSPGGIFTS